jgi:hypothetical protein
MFLERTKQESTRQDSFLFVMEKFKAIALFFTLVDDIFQTSSSQESFHCPNDPKKTIVNIFFADFVQDS